MEPTIGDVVHYGMSTGFGFHTGVEHVAAIVVDVLPTGCDLMVFDRAGALSFRQQIDYSPSMKLNHWSWKEEGPGAYPIALVGA